MAAVPEDQMSDDSYEHIDSPCMDDMELKDHHDYISLDPDCADDAERVVMLRGFIAQMKVTIGNLQEAGLLARKEVIEMDTQLQDRELENEEKDYELGEKDREIALLTEQIDKLRKELAEERAERAAERAAAAVVAAAKVEADVQTDPDVPCPAPASTESDELAPFLRKVRELSVVGVPAESLAMAAPLQPTANRPWHVYVSNYERQVMVVNLTRTIFPSPDPVAIHDQRIKDLCAYARKTENDIFENADEREEYYHLLAEKMMKIRKELAEKKQARLAAANAPIAAVAVVAAAAAPAAPPTVAQAAQAAAPVAAVLQAPAVPTSPASPPPTSTATQKSSVASLVARAQPIDTPASAAAAPQRRRSTSKPRSSVDPEVLAEKIRFVKQPGAPTEGFNWPLPHAATASKDWHGAVPMEERRQLIGKIIMSVFPNLFPIFPCENNEKRRINEIIEASRDIEKGYFSVANDQEDYYRMLAEKMLKSQSLMEKKKQRKLKETAAEAAALAAGSARQARNLQQLLLVSSTSQLQLVSPSVLRFNQLALIPTPASAGPLCPPVAESLPKQVTPVRQVKKEEIDSKDIKQEPQEPVPSQQYKSWHSTISSGLRQQLRTKLALTVLPSDASAHGCGTSERVTQYAKQKEAEAYWRADSKDEYFRLLAEAIQQSQMDVDEDDEPSQSVGEILASIRELDNDPIKSRIKPGKAWHAGFPVELRNQICLKLPAMMSPADPNVLIGFAKTTESELFENAASKVDYYRLLSERIFEAHQNSQEDEATKQSADDILNAIEQLETIYNEFA